MLVTSSRDSSHAMEFELTRNQHMKGPHRPFTVTACFKQPVMKLIPEAWRILLEVTKGHELLPDHVAAYREKVLARWRRTVDDDRRTDILARVRQNWDGPLSGSSQMAVAKPARSTKVVLLKRKRSQSSSSTHRHSKKAGLTPAADVQSRSGHITKLQGTLYDVVDHMDSAFTSMSREESESAKLC